MVGSQLNGRRKSCEVGDGTISLCSCFSDQTHKHYKEENCTSENGDKDQDKRP
ncbi:hypothetical protein AVEN_101051-1, partial [Araneus ventricosus]